MSEKNSEKQLITDKLKGLFVHNDLMFAYFCGSRAYGTDSKDSDIDDVTSVLRTKDDVKRLRKGNGNASLNSAHFYGTTFDVAYARFKKVEDPDGCTMQDVSQDTLKLVLAEVLYDMQKNKKCYIKYEVKQGCFHITAR